MAACQGHWVPKEREPYWRRMVTEPCCSGPVCRMDGNRKPFHRASAAHRGHSPHASPSTMGVASVGA
eukprot:873058-Amphidinium_carterae.1